MYKNNKSNKSKRLPHADNNDVYTWDNYDLHHPYNEEVNNLPPTMKQNVSTQTNTKISTCLCDKCHHSYNDEIPATKQNASTQTPPQNGEIKYVKSIAQKQPIMVRTLKLTKTTPTQTSIQTSSSSVQTEPQKENKFSLFRFLLFLIHQI